MIIDKHDAHAALVRKEAKPFWRSKKLWATLGAVGAVVAQAVAAGGIGPQTVPAIVGAVAVYLLGQAHVDAATAKALGEVASSAARHRTE